MLVKYIFIFIKDHIDIENGVTVDKIYLLSRRKNKNGELVPT